MAAPGVSTPTVNDLTYTVTHPTTNGATGLISFALASTNAPVNTLGQLYYSVNGSAPQLFGTATSIALLEGTHVVKVFIPLVSTPNTTFDASEWVSTTVPILIHGPHSVALEFNAWFWFWVVLVIVVLLIIAYLMWTQ